MASDLKRIKRYNLALPEDLFNELQQTADQRQTTVVELLRKFIKLGLLIIQTEDSSGSTFWLKEGDSEKQIILI